LTPVRYAILCTIDRAQLDLLGRLRAEHYRFLLAHRETIAFGGPMRSGEGAPPETMLMVVDASSQAEAERFIAAEPYNAHGGFRHVVVRPWSQVIPEAEPGALQRTLDAELARA
jgi:uncharacterized protein YciI